MRICQLVSLVLATLVLGGCAPTRLAMRPLNYNVDVQLDPYTHLLEAKVSIELSPTVPNADSKRSRLELLLHPDLEVQSVEVQGATLQAHKQRNGKSDEGSVTRPTIHRLILKDMTDRLAVTLTYRGRLHQDVASGEKAGEIHNYSVTAHIGEEGLYLEPSGYWYPRVEFPTGIDPNDTLAGYRLSVQPVDDFEMVAGVQRDDVREDGALQWSSPFPLEGLVLLGGPFQRSSRMHGDIQLHTVLAPGKEEVARDILDASAEYLDRYEALIGPYPFKEFTVLEAFFSSGFAFPTSTQIAGSQLSRFQQYRRHGYLDHELLHNWYGNGIFVDPRDGNWCEGLSSYMGNYYGFVLDGDEAGARKQRRNHSNFLSSITPKHDKPLGTFGLENGAGRGIGYSKSASVFHMLERKIGEDAMFEGLRLLTTERMGKFASWEHLREVFEKASNSDLETFFEQWVRGSGAPLLELTHAEFHSDPDGVSVTISQGPIPFELDLPLRLHYDDRSIDVVVPMNKSVDTIDIPCNTNELIAIELDPDYHLFRRLKPEEVMPTSSLTLRGEQVLVVVPEGVLEEGYQVLFDATDDGHDLLVRQAQEVQSAELMAANVLILGEAARHPTVAHFLERTRSPVSWSDEGFAIEGRDYSGRRQAVYLTVHHPDRPEGGVTVYFGNSAEALSNASVLGYYANSLLVFDTPEGSTEIDSADTMPRAEVVHRMDFEFHERIDF